MTTLIRGAFLGLLFFPFLTFAQSALPSPQDLLKKAEQDASQLRQAVEILEISYPKMRDVTTFESYFFLLDRLQGCAEKFRTPKTPPVSLSSLGAGMARWGVQWVQVSSFSSDRVLYYQKWLDEAGTAEFLKQVEKESAGLSEVTAQRKMLENLELLSTFIESKFFSRKDLLDSVRQSLSATALKLLQQPGQEDSNVERWIVDLRSESAQREYLKILSRQIQALHHDTRSAVHLYEKRLALLFAAVEMTNGSAETYQGLGDAGEKLFTFFVEFEEAFQGKELRQILDILTMENLRDLSVQWKSFEPSDEFMPAYLQAAKEFVRKLLELEMAAESSVVAEQAGYYAAPSMARILKAEGRYELKDSEGHIWHVLFFQTRQMRMEVLAWRQGEARGKRYGAVSWDLERGMFSASDSVSLLRFKISEDVIEGVFPFAKPSLRKLTGFAKEKFTDFIVGAKDSVRIDGAYSGTLQMPGGSAQAVELKVGTLNGHYQGHFTVASQATSLDLGSRAPGPVLYLTCGASDSVKDFSHLRLRLEGTQLKGLLITAERGTGTVVLTK